MTRVLYLAGSGRSGSTILAQYLEESFDVIHVGELRYLWERGLGESQLCQCGHPFRSCPFWGAVLEAAYPQGAHVVRTQMAELARQVDRLRYVVPNLLFARGVVQRQASQRYQELIAPLYRAVSEVSGAAVVLDSSKDPSYLFALNGVDGIELSVVHLVRDSRAVAYSWTRNRRRPEIHWEEQQMQVLPPTRAAREWLQNNVAVELLALSGRKPIRLRYEDFARQPDEVVRALQEPLRLQRRSAPGQAFHSFSGNPIRFEKKRAAIKPDIAWISHLPGQDRRAVTGITAPLLLRYGYPLVAGRDSRRSRRSGADGLTT